MFIFHMVMTILILGCKYFIRILSVIFRMTKTAFKTLTVGFISLS